MNVSENLPSGEIISMANESGWHFKNTATLECLVRRVGVSDVRELRKGDENRGIIPTLYPLGRTNEWVFESFQLLAVF